MHKKFEINLTKIKDGCQSGRKVVPHNAKSNLLLIYFLKLQILKKDILFYFSPHLLAEHQAYIQKQLACSETKPTFLVMHGGSGSTQDEIQAAVRNGVIKMNIDTDTQWAYWDGLKNFYKKNEGYLQTQVGNPDGEDKPNKKFYDPRVWIRASEDSMIARAKESFKALNSAHSYQ